MTEQRAASIALVTSAGTALIGLLGMIGQVSEFSLLTAWPLGSTPIAFWVSLGLFLMGVVAIASVLYPESSAVRGAVVIVALLGLAGAAASLNQRFSGSSVDIEQLAPFRWFARLSPPTIRSTGPLGPPIILVACVALLLHGVRRGRRLMSALAALPVIIGLLVSIGFLYDSPLLKISGWRPVSLAAALSAILFGTSLIFLAGPDVWPLRPFVGSSVRAQLLRWFMPFTVLIVVLTDVFTTHFFSDISPALGSILNTVMSCVGAVLVTAYLARRIGDRLDRAERETARVSRLYALLSHTNALITRATDAKTLLDEACAIAVEQGGFETAWVGEIDRAATVMRPVAAHGSSAAYLDGLTMALGEAAPGSGPASEAAQAERPVVCADLLRYPWRAARAREMIVESGLRTSASFPLTTLDATTHVYSMYSKESGWFSDEQVALLTRLATDLSFALGSIAKEKKRALLEEQLRQAQKMETIGQLAGGIAHDFNNMLSIVMANTELVSSTLPAEFVEAASELRDVRDAAARGKALVRQLMSFSRAGHLEFDTTDVGVLAERVVRMLRRMLPETVILECAVEAGLPPGWADPGAVEQMILNLSTNARDAMPNGGRLQVAVRRPNVSDLAREAPRTGDSTQYVCLAVTDTGTGMDEATLARVFDPFFTTKPPGKGTGLGLAMVQGIMRQHGGFARIASELDRGTSVRLFFPTAKGGIAGPVDDAMRLSPRALYGSETVLVVEDEEALRRAVQRILERHGYRVYAAEDGIAALELLRRSDVRVDLILTDLIMPRLGGVELYEQVTKEFGKRRFLVASGYNPGESATDGGPLKDVPFIRKPWTLVEVLESVRKSLEAEQ